MSNLKRITASGAIVTGDVSLRSVCLAAAGANATVILDDSADGSGADLLSLAAAANSTSCWRTGDRDGVAFGTAVYATLSGASASVAVEYC